MVLYLERDEETKLYDSFIYEDKLTDIKEAEKIREQFIQKYDWDPENISVLQYKE
jgi:hypothetical protein